MSARQSVKLLTCYCYTCLNCGRENYVHGVTPDLPEEQMQEVRSDLGIEPWEEGEVMCIPDTVKCRECGTEYESGTEDDEFEEEH